MSISRKAEILCYVVFVVAMFILPVFLDEFGLNRIAKFLIYGMLATAIALSWGYAGILNLGQGLFFGLGAYMLAMSLKLASPTSLAHGAGQPIPDFMLWNAEPGAPQELCCITKVSFLWVPFQSQWFGIAMAIILPVGVAYFLGTLLFRQRVAGVFVSIVTLALVLLARLLIVNMQSLTNGFNGLTDLAWLTVGGVEFDPYSHATYYLVAISCAAALVGSRLLTETRAGLILQAIRDDQNRARYLGFDVPMYQVFFFCASALIATVAGMLFVVVTEFSSPTLLDLSFSIMMVVWAAVGGRSSLLGACLGAILINLIEAQVSETEALLEAWKAIIGAIFILVVLFMPRGIAGLGSDLVAAIRRRGPSGENRIQHGGRALAKEER